MSKPETGGFAGTSVRRSEDTNLMRGQGRFVADCAEGAYHVVFVRSAEPHARILGIDSSAALSMTGIVGVYTAADLGVGDSTLPTLTTPNPAFVRATGFHMAEQRMPLLASDRVHYVGQPVAVVVATDRYRAEDAAESVAVSYRALEPVLDPEHALAEGTPPLFEHLDGNEVARIDYSFGDPDDAFVGAHRVVSGRYRMGRHGAVPLENRGVVARPDRRLGQVEVITSTQIPHLVRNSICSVTGWPEHEVLVRVPDVGGGFGTKANVYAEEILLAVLARTTGHAVAWAEDRQEHLTASAQGRDQVHRTRLAVDERGRILAWADDFVVDVGAGSLWVAGIVANTAVHALGPYRVPAAAIRGRAALTTKTIVAQYRGAGRPEATFALERSLDAAAAELGISGREIRDVNLLTPDDLPYSRPIPYRDGVPIVYDGGDYRACLDAVSEMLPAGEVDRLRAEHPGSLLGYGLASYLEATGRGPHETARLRVLGDGRIEVITGAASAGQGHATVFTQVAADALELPMDQVRYLPADTERLPDGVGTFASRSAVLAGSAVHNGARSLVERACREAGRLLGGDGPARYTGGTFACGQHRVGWAELARATRLGGSADAHALDVTEVFAPETVTWTMGVHAVVVAVDPRTGFIRVLRYAVAHEGGHELNPRIVRGQIVGGVAQGIGGALFEEFGYAASGQPLSTTLAAYHLPLSTDVPSVDVRHLHVDTPVNPIGARGAGESGTIAVYPAIAGAVDDALGGGVHLDSTPIDTGTVWRAAQPTGSAG